MSTTPAATTVAVLDLHLYVQRELARAGHNYIQGRQRARTDLLVCALEGGGSGAGQLIKPYRDENRIHRDCALDRVRSRQPSPSARAGSAR